MRGGFGILELNLLQRATICFIVQLLLMQESQNKKELSQKSLLVICEGGTTVANLLDNPAMIFRSRAGRQA